MATTKLRRLWALIVAVLFGDGLVRVRMPGGQHGHVHLPSHRFIPPLAGADEGDGDDGDEGDGEGDGDEGDGDESGDDEGEGKVDWKDQSRKHERRSKAEKKRADALQKKLDDIAAANQTDQEKAIAEAKAEAKSEAEAAIDKERRADRLEAAVIKQAAKAIKVGDAEHRFADIDDAQVHIERAIARGDVDADDIFDDKGKVQTDALVSALAEILEKKPHLRADGKPSRGSGSSDAGSGGGAGDLDEDSVEAHLKKIQRHK